MNPVSLATMGVLVLTIHVGAAAQTQAPVPGADEAALKELTELCATNDTTDAAELVQLKAYTSPALEQALLSSRKFWDFITDPSTKCLDRMAAANRGAAALSLEDLHLLWQSMAELQSGPVGVMPSPCAYIMSANLTPAMWAGRRELYRPRQPASRIVFGREMQWPKANVDFPVTGEERDRSSWLWQMERALSILFTNVNKYYGDPGRYPLRVKAAWDWPVSGPSKSDAKVPAPGDWEAIHVRSQALTEWAPRNLLLFQTILKLALSNDDFYVPYSAPVEDLMAWGQDSYHFEELAHVAQIAILQKAKWENVSERTAFLTAELARYKPDPNSPHLLPMRTATAILAIGRWATDSSVDPWNRYASFVGPICRIVDDPPFPADELRDPDDERLNAKLKTFEAWFEKKRPLLEQQAESEKPHLQSLANELSTNLE